MFAIFHYFFMIHDSWTTYTKQINNKILLNTINMKIKNNLNIISHFLNKVSKQKYLSNNFESINNEENSCYSKVISDKSIYWWKFFVVNQEYLWHEKSFHQHDKWTWNTFLTRKFEHIWELSKNFRIISEW